MSGHVFIIHGDLTNLLCDAWLLPSDRQLFFQEYWLKNIKKTDSDWIPNPLYFSEIQLNSKRAIRIPDWPEHDSSPFLTNTGGSERTEPQWYAEGVKEFLLEAIEHTKNSVPLNNRQKHLLALPLVGAGSGGAAERAGLIVETILPVMYEIIEKFNVDIALVIKDEMAYSVAQTVRRKLIAAKTIIWPNELNQSIKDEALRLADISKKGELVLFLGAGVSASAGVPLWNELLTELAMTAKIFTGKTNNQSDFDDLDSLDKARLISLRLQLQNLSIGDKVVDEIKKYKKSSLNHIILSSLPVREAITTNYDELFENASNAIGKRVAILPYQPAIYAERWLLKMHGCVSKPKDIVLTRSDYLGYNDQRAALRGIVQAMLLTKHLLFVGFSLTDDNFHTIIEDVRKAVNVNAGEDLKTNRHAFGTALTLRNNPFFEELWQKDLNWICFEKKNIDRNPNINEIARIQEIFFDFLACHATSNTSHILDKKYRTLLSREEEVLCDELLSLKKKISTLGNNNDALAEFSSFLKKLGDR